MFRFTGLEPLAFWPLTTTTGGKDIMDQAIHGETFGVIPEVGPAKELNTAFQFTGHEHSYVSVYGVDKLQLSKVYVTKKFIEI